MFERFSKSKLSIFLYSFLLFSIGSFYISFFPPDEPKYVDAALRMIETHNYIIPYFNCHVRFDKPILFYWELVFFFKIFSVDSLLKVGHDFFGIIEYAARLPAIISGSLTAVYIYLLSYKLFKDRRIAQLSVIGFLSVLFFFYLPRSVYPDMSLILFELAGVYYFIEGKYCLGWFFTALAFLTKGPIGIISVGFTYFLYLWIVERKTGLKEFFSIKNGIGFLIFLAIGMPWYALVYKYYGIEFIDKFVIYHNLERFTGKAHQHPHSFFYYFPIAIGFIYMWWPYLIDLVKRVDLKNRRVVFLALWFLWIFLFFSISRNKLPHYIAFGFIPLSIIFGLYIGAINNTKRKAYSMFILELLAGIVAFFYLYKIKAYNIMLTTFFGLFFVAFLNFVKDPAKSIFYKTFALSIVAFVVLLQFEGYRPEKRIWHKVINTHLPLVEYKINNQSLVAYLRECFQEIKNRGRLRKIKPPFLLYTKQKYLENIPLKYNILFKAQDKGTKTALLLIYGQ